MSEDKKPANSVVSADSSPSFGSTFDLDHRDYPVCPHCGNEHRDAWEWDFGPGVEGECVTWCHSCGGEMSVSKMVTITYTSQIPRKSNIVMSHEAGTKPLSKTNL